MREFSGAAGGGQFGKLAYGPVKNAAYGSAVKGGGGKAAAGAAKAAAAGIGGKLMGVLLLLIGIPLALGLVIGGVLFSGKKEEVVPLPPPPPRRRMPMGKLIVGRAVIVLLAIGSLGLLTLAGTAVYNQFRDRQVVIATGGSDGESYVLLQAVKTVAARYYPRIKIAIRETGGTTESLSALEKGTAQLAAEQGDVPAGPNARSVALLFDDTFQLLAHNGSGINGFADLKGKKVALPKTGGQYKSFLYIGSHYGLKPGDFTFVGGDDPSADLSYARGEADAIFRVRALHNVAIQHIVGLGNTSFVPIDNGAALHVESPAYSPATIPKGTYEGNPPVPAVDLPTVATERLLVARRDVEDDVIYALTEILMERHQEIAAAIPDNFAAMRGLVAHTTQPAVRAGLEAPLHPGAKAFYNKDQTPFVVSHADGIAAALAALVLIALWVGELRRSFAVSQKYHADNYNIRLTAVLKEAQALEPGQDTTPIRNQLTDMLIEAIRDLDADKLSEDSFRSFHAIWQTAMDMVRDNVPLVMQQDPAAMAAAAGAENMALRPTPRWSLARFLHQKPV